MDWRIKTIFALVIAAIAATAFVYYKGYGLDPQTHIGAVFAAWVGGLALFMITGIVVAIISLARPERESFDARARILFRRQAGKHIDYIISKIRDILEHYGEITKVKVTLMKYHEDDKKYLLNIHDSIILKSYLGDVDTTWKSEINYAEIKLPPANCQSNRLIYVRIDNNPIATMQDFTDKIQYPISTRIKRNASCKIEYLVEYWAEANEERNSHMPVRYNQNLVLEFENLTANAVTVKISEDGEKWIDLIINPAEIKLALHLQDVLPDKNAYEFRVMAP